MSNSAELNRVGHVIVRRRDWQRNIARNMQKLALREQSKSRERICVFPAGQPADRAYVCLIDSKRRAISTRPRQFFRPSWHELPVLADNCSVGADKNECVKKCPERNRTAFIHSDN